MCHGKLHYISFKCCKLSNPAAPYPIKKSTVPYSNYLHAFLCILQLIYASSTF